LYVGFFFYLYVLLGCEIAFLGMRVLYHMYFWNNITWTPLMLRKCC